MRVATFRIEGTCRSREFGGCSRHRRSESCGVSQDVPDQPRVPSPVNDSSAAAVASRLRVLFAKPDDVDWSVVAERLRVSELALRMSIDDLDPHPAVEVVAATVARYGVDPNWLLTGVYDAETHRRVLEEEGAGNAAVIDTLRKLTPENTEAIADHHRSA